MLSQDAPSAGTREMRRKKKGEVSGKRDGSQRKSKTGGRRAGCVVVSGGENSM